MTIMVVGAEGLPSKDGLFGGASDPYCCLHHHGEERKTSTKSGMANPEWRETFEYHLSANDEIFAQVRDSDLLMDDDIGSVTIPASEFFKIAQENLFLEARLTNRKSGKRTGMLILGATFRDRRGGYQSSQPTSYTTQTSTVGRPSGYTTAEYASTLSSGSRTAVSYGSSSVQQPSYSGTATRSYAYNEPTTYSTDRDAARRRLDAADGVADGRYQGVAIAGREMAARRDDGVYGRRM
eukprot:NODE_2474_length_919_cov_118.829885_g2031_i0.p1 GENE.NODE_2474_length_919_cov_118.829885_g2031_i0~~NODE_2474_length_919_cov_118.829885_g2031_i0.p1  ORF type:complete len:251 (-),score=43.66 NODE_2474_length_919_cov_118.829885_g2031_i0:166-879(-)